MLPKRILLVSLVAMFAWLSSAAQPSTIVDRKASAEQVRTEFLHAWNGYKKYAWGHDDLKPLSKSFHNWYPEPLLMSPVDGLDTMYLMGIKDEADKTREYITANLKF